MCQFSAAMGHRRIESLITSHKALPRLGKFTGRMSVSENLAEILINRIADRIPCAMTAYMTDINRLVPFGSRGQSHIVKTVHEIFPACSVQVSHHLGLGVILAHNVLHSELGLGGSPLLRSRGSLGE